MKLMRKLTKSMKPWVEDELRECMSVSGVRVRDVTRRGAMRRNMT